MSLFTGKGCLNCQSRGKRCDESRPACRRCTRAGIECAGYPTLGNLGHTVSESRTKQTRAPPTSVASLLNYDDEPRFLTTGALVPVPRVAMAKVEPYIRPETSNPFLPELQASSGSVGIAMRSDNIPSSSKLDAWSGTSFIGPPSATIEELDVAPAPTSAFTRSSYVHPVIGQPLTPPYGPHDLPNPSPVMDLDPMPAPIQNTGLGHMTSGQASLFDALFSLARPGEEYYQPSTLITQSSHACDQVVRVSPPEPRITKWCFIGENENDEDLQDTEGIGDIMTKTLTLDRNVESNSLPFILECYALWIGRMIFQPLRVAAAGREYVLRLYGRSEAARRNLMLVSIIARIVASSTAFDIDKIPEFTEFRSGVTRGYVIASSTKNSSRSVDLINTSIAISSTYELISVSCKLFPLSTVFSHMHAAAPVFRRACPGPPEELVHLPSLLLHLDSNLRYFATMDVLLSVLTVRPMFFRYNVDFTPNVTESMVNIENHLGIHWLYGVPDRLVVTLARINAIREDLGTCTDQNVVSELESEIRRFRAILGTSICSDPVLTVARLVVQECWRQAAFIYLYMGMCGANSRDARVVTAHDKFMELFKGVRPARHPDSFLIFPMVILGTATLREEERSMIKRRMLNLHDCSRPRTLGNEIIQILDDVWSQTNISGKPAVWSNLRLACSRVTGI